MKGKHHSLDCKHKHMMKSGAPHDNFGILSATEFHGFNIRIDFNES